MASPYPMTQNLALALVSLRPSQSKNYFATDGRSVSQSAPLGFMTRFLLRSSLSWGVLPVERTDLPCNNSQALSVSSNFWQHFSVRSVVIWYDFSTDCTENMPESHLNSVPQGHDTTSVGICWALFLLGLNPVIQVSVKNAQELVLLFW
jgi:hypothetical protein